MLSDDGVATLLEDAEGSRAHGHEVSIAIADSRLYRGDAACAVDEVDVETELPGRARGLAGVVRNGSLQVPSTDPASFATLE